MGPDGQHHGSQDNADSTTIISTVMKCLYEAYTGSNEIQLWHPMLLCKVFLHSNPISVLHSHYSIFLTIPTHTTNLP
jgi:hypothetical protein